ncbi:hypothetical protein [Oribacterium sp. NK2B42]|uniref:hypothetical protein n=1 Tax=Oribacterium sp. NK2B42 TaxID=689781 RepID=UPI00040A2A2C|nr:hypothetical protein [Oribacterium sp. NK2B42]
MDDYVEHMVKRNDPVYWKAALGIAAVLTVISLFLALQYAFALLLLLAMMAADYAIWLFSSVEYGETHTAFLQQSSRLLSAHAPAELLYFAV